jgi:uncharacterized 2Fe-2S/4Fe-4S cluster protein (DUF4445 family)
MRAAEGAIERIRITKEHRVEAQTIGNVTPVGICGSGVLDVLAACHFGKIINDQGRILESHPDVANEQGRRSIRLSEDVFFTQEDVRAVQLAKASIRAATDMLLSRAGIEASQIQRCVIAGSFGAYIDVKSAVAIGMLPGLPIDSYSQVGNAAGLGTRMMLLSKQARSRADELANDCEYIELSSKREFQNVFLRNISFPAEVGFR